MTRSPAAALALRLAIATSAASLAPTALLAQMQDTLPAPAMPKPKPWYERLSLRGYAQLRYNRLLETNEDLTCPQCDRSIGKNNGFFLRRGRIVLSGNVHERLSVYIQPDFAADAAGQLHYLQLRDAYFDLYLDRAHAHRLRLGQSKVPFGFENLQSSSNRLPLDRADALNSAVPNERDLGVFYYLSPRAAADRFKFLTDSGLKGSGDYGVLGVGLFNGQTANRPELNDNLHAVAHLTYPFRVGHRQIVELAAHGYHGRFVIPTSQRTAGVTAPLEFLDERVAASFVLYPQPFGFQAEWTVGRGPEFDPASIAIRTRRAEGGYVQASWRARRAGQVITPFIRAQTYRGGKKLETDARRYDLHEVEGGVEWLPISAFELTASYVSSSRRSEDRATIGNRQEGRFLRLQAQVNY